MPIKFLNNVSVDQDVLYVDGENNRVGIGTTEPSQKLEVTGNGLFGNGNTPITLQVGEATGYTSQTNSTLKLAQGGGNYHEFIGSRSTGEEGSIYRMQEYTDGSLVRMTQTYDGDTTQILYGNTVSISGISTNISNVDYMDIRQYIDHDNDNDTRFGFPAIDTFAIDTNGSERMRVTSTGNVGIGTTSPVTKLDVNGDIAIKNAILASFDNNNGNLSIGSDSGQMNLLNNSLVIDYSGDVGIGDTNPNAKLTVFRTDSTYAVNLSDTESRAGLSVKSSSNFDSKLTISAGAGGVQQIQGVNNAATASRNIAINPYGGNVGIGKTNASDKLDVQGNIRTSGYIFIREDADNSLFLNSNGGGYISGESDESITLMIRSSGASYLNGGDVGIGTSGPNSKLHVLGGIQLANDTTAASASKVGTLRYYTSGNNSYVDMCMQTGAATYAWVNIVTNSW